MIRFKNKEEFDAHFTEMAEYDDKDLSDTLCIEGNSGTTLSWLRNIAEQIGYENISVSDDVEYTDTVELDVSGNPKANFNISGDEVSYSNGVITIWWD